MKTMRILVVLAMAIWFEGLCAAPVVSGVPWWDQNGKAVNAHGICVVEDNGTFYMFGEWKSDESNAFPGYGCYSSKNLADWRFEGVALPLQKDGILGPDRVGERPKVFKTKSGKWIMLAHADNLFYKDPSVALAVAESPAGRYEVIGSLADQNGKIKNWDLGIFTDDDGETYLLGTHGKIWRMSSDGLSATRIKCELKNDDGTAAKGGESPCMLKKDGIYWLFYSHLTSWERNDNFVFRAASIEGPWIYKGNFAPEGTLTWNSQCSFILKYRDGHIYMGDRWSFPHQASAATQVWQPFSFDSDCKPSLGEYVEAWDVETFGKVAMKSQTLWQGNWEADEKGKALKIPFCGGRIAVRADTRPDAGYGRISIKTSSGETLRSDIVDFYAKKPIDGQLVWISPVIAAGEYILEIEPNGDHPEWSDKRKTHYGSTVNTIRVARVESVQL